MPSRSFLILACATFAACSSGDRAPARAPDASHTPVAQGSAAPSPVATATWRVTYAGIGPLRAGLTMPEAAALLQTTFAIPNPADTAACDQLSWDGAPVGVSVLVENGRIGRVDVASGTVTTEAGARIGDTEERIKSLYPGRVTVEPHHYTDGHYLIVTPELPADSAFRIVFETDSNRVTMYRAGKLPQVKYVEGCA